MMQYISVIEYLVLFIQDMANVLMQDKSLPWCASQSLSHKTVFSSSDAKTILHPVYKLFCFWYQYIGVAEIIPLCYRV